MMEKKIRLKTGFGFLSVSSNVENITISINKTGRALDEKNIFLNVENAKLFADEINNIIDFVNSRPDPNTPK